MAPYNLLVLATLLCLVPVHAVALTNEPLIPRPDPIMITEVKVLVSEHGPVVLLQAEGRTIPIFVDVTVALSIQSALNGEQLSRPMTHDLMRAILDAYGGKVTQTVITLQGGVYVGALTVLLKDQVKVFDSRSSDSIALAIHFNAPILVGRDLLESAGKVPEQENETEL